MGICESVKSNNSQFRSRSSTTRKSSKILNEMKIDQSVLVGKEVGSPLEKYSVIKQLGEGSYGKVFLVKHKETQSERAMKEIRKNNEVKRENEQEIINEIEILKKLDHPNIVKIYEFFITLDRYYLITEYCKEGELYDKILKFAPFEESHVCSIMYQIFSVIYYCHNHNIIHRDLKPENILIEGIDVSSGEFQIKVIDFGTAKIFERNSYERRVIGSSYYIAPEVLSQNYTEKCDLWSCGVILYILLSGQAPFDGNSDDEILSKIKLGKYEMKSGIWEKISSNPKKLISNLLVSDPVKRFSAKEALRHPFFSTFVRKRRCSISTNKILGYIRNLQKYQPNYKLQQAALAFIVHNLPNNDDIRDLNKLFELLDENGDFQITKNELKVGFKTLLTKEDNEIDIDLIFSNVDADNNGYIDNEEFIRACIDKEKILTDSNLKHAFSYFDKDSSGHITITELKQVFCADGKNKVDEEVLKELVDEADTNKDGQISFEEFRIMMMDIFEKKLLE